MADVALITLHGMGKVKKDYYEDLLNGLRKRLGDDFERVSFLPVQYAPLLQAPQRNLWDRMEAVEENDLDATKLRQFFLYGFGDAGSLEHSAHRDGMKYRAVQNAVRDMLEEAYRDLGNDRSKPVVIVAQSLGCQVISNYLWDARGAKPCDQSIFSDMTDVDEDLLKFLKLNSLKHLVTTGCNIPLFVSGLDTVECFNKPDDFRWDNYYDADDVLGWPLAQLGEGFETINDHPINAGGWITSWNTFSHVKYWSDDDVLDPIAGILRQHLGVEGEAPSK